MKTGNYFFAALTVFIALTMCTMNCMTGTVQSISPEKPAALAFRVTENNINDPSLVWISPDHHASLDSAPAIFYSPHQDDETIGMGATIAEQVRLGKSVYIVLLTNGVNANMLNFLQSISPDASMQDVVDARNNEFIAACKALGVDRVYISNAGKGYDEKESLAELTSHFKKTMSYFCQAFTNASHHTISGNCDSYNPNCDKMPAHQAAASAMHELYNSGTVSQCLLFRAYFYYKNSPNCDRPCNWMKPVNHGDKLRRQRAINEYKLVDEKNHRYGLGYWHSVDVLFNNSWDSDYEMVDSMKNDY